MKPYTIEACVENFNEARIAIERGADEIELCADLSVGGLTPDKNLIAMTLEYSPVVVKVMIRPRAGDFCYNRTEINRMKTSIRYCRDNGVKEIVLGVLTGDKTVDYALLKELAILAEPMKITFHKAIDEVVDPVEAIAGLELVDNVHAILSSGKAATALNGVAVLRSMLSASDRLTIISAGKVTNENLKEVHHQIGGKAYHGRKILGELR